MRFDHFDFLAPFYDRLIPTADEHLLAEIAGLPVSGRLLDAGGGTGRVAQQLVEQAGLVVIADSSLNMLAQAQSKASLCCAVGSHAESLPFSSESFERVVVVDAFHHLRDQMQSLHEFWRVIEPGGRVVIEEPDIRHIGVKLVALAEKLALFRSRFLSGERIAGHLQTLGARVTIFRQDVTVWVVAEKPNPRENLVLPNIPAP